MKITIETVVKASLSSVWDAWNNPEDIKQWNTAQDDWHTTRSTVDLREGGKFLSRMEAKDGSEGFDFEGIYTRIVPHKTIEYRMSDGREVKVEFVERPDATLVKTAFDAETENPPEIQRTGWQAILDNFGRHVEAKPVMVGAAATLAGGGLVAVPGMEDAMASTQSEVRALLDSRSEAMRMKDIDRLMSLYSPDIVYFDLVPPLQYAGSAALRARFSQWFDGWEGSIGMEIHDLKISASGDTAAAFMLLRASGIRKNGHEVGYWVRTTNCCQRSNHGWLITHEHVSLPVDFESGRAVMDLVP